MLPGICLVAIFALEAFPFRFLSTCENSSRHQPPSPKNLDYGVCFKTPGGSSSSQ
jgi:hypothetical protein